jgi:hypothetical protein
MSLYENSRLFLNEFECIRYFPSLAQYLKKSIIDGKCQSQQGAEKSQKAMLMAHFLLVLMKIPDCF